MKKLREGGEVQTFAAGFSDPRFDELPYARQVSEAVGTTHHEVMVSADDFRELWETLTWHSRRSDQPAGGHRDLQDRQTSARRGQGPALR